MRTFDYSFLEFGMLPAGLVNVIEAIAQLRERGNERKKTCPDVFACLESIARVQSAKGSNEIEGIVTSEQRIVEIVNQNSGPINRGEAEIAGYRDVLDLIHSEYTNLDIREHDILYLHEIMLSYTPASGGQYKSSDNVIMEAGAGGTRYIGSEPTTAPETAEAMGQLILAYMDARNNCSINQLLLIPCFILDFLCVQPFTDGNGRISRLLSLLLLYKNGFDAGRYISFEEQLSHVKTSYYRSLDDSSIGWHEGRNTYFPFMENFATTLLYCYKELDKRFVIANAKKTTKRQRIETTVMNNPLPFSKAEICYILPDVSPTTVEAVLSSMVRDGRIGKIGSARNTKYVTR